MQPPIQDYALIGDCHGAALVSSAGSIDWCALLRFDGDPVFFGLLDSRGGGWRFEAKELRRASRAYLPRTNILRTRFETATGVAELCDFMPVGRTREASVHDYVTLNAPGWLVRRLECVEGEVDVEMLFSPRGPDFPTRRPEMTVEDGRVRSCSGPTLWLDGETTLDGDGARQRLRLRAGEVRTFVLTATAPLNDPRPRSDDMFCVTRAFWTEWTEYSRYRGPYEDAVWRSALALKLLTYAPTGALVAAATTSLPETPGGARNWDYRHCWIRDATFSLFALSSLGFSAEGRRFSDFLTHRCLREGSQLRIMYGIEGEPFLPERELDHLEGYRGARPVRVGNEASEQLQLDVFGEVLDWAELRAALGSRLNRDERALLKGLADHVVRTWRLPDQGLWEVRTGAKHFTQGKAMAWVTLDRAIRLLGDKPGWREARDEILAAINAEGCSGDPPWLAQHFGADSADAALLQIPLLGLPLDENVIAETVRRVESELREGDLVYRYRSEDGLEGEEGAFLITSFWLVAALLTLDRAREARELFDRLLARANDVGLYAEEVDPVTGDFLGNFPQAFTHLSLISSAQLLHLYEIRGRRALRGSNADRARRLVGATEGLRALVYALIRNRNVRLFSSKKSVLELT